MKLLEQSFNNMRELAEFLVSNLYVNSKSVSAFTVIAAMEEAGAQKGMLCSSLEFYCHYSMEMSQKCFAYL